ncbi:MAG: hypothetical protein JW864_09590 [Spirochaetes bacterium]|nr:hypothetical protein [Spirochaetota bacterium]
MISITAKLRIIAALAVMLLYNIPAYSATEKTEAADKKITVRIHWPEVENAVRYKILIRNQEGKVIINTDTDINSIDISVIPGDYTMRIGAVNKFQKIGSWSDWASVDVEKPEPPPVIVEKKPEKKAEGTYMPLKIGVGIAYVYILPDLNEILDNTFTSGNLIIGYGLGKVIPLSFFRHTGIEAEAGITWFDGKDADKGISLEKSDILAGGNIFFNTNLNFPLNLIIRGGAGIVLTHMGYKNTSGYTTIDSQDMYYKIGSAVEIVFSHFFAEIGADYLKILYIGDQFSSVNCFMRAGVRF